MANMNFIGVFVTKVWPVQALAYGGGDGGVATQNIISPKFSNFRGYNYRPLLLDPTVRQNPQHQLILEYHINVLSKILKIR